MSEKEKQALIERCETISAWRAKYGDLANVMLPAIEAQEIAKIALAALTAQPVDFYAPAEIEAYVTNLQQRAEAAEAKAKNLNDGWLNAIAERDEARTDQGKLEAARSVKDIWKERAWAAEEKLAELEKQEPVAWHIYQWRDSPKGWGWYLTKSFSSQPKIGDGWKSDPLFARPAPAARLAELIPPEMTWKDSDSMQEVAGFNLCRDTTLRNIKEAK